MEKKRDSKNRVLRERESQLSDGRYRYTYYEGRKQKSLYSWKLEPTDKLPKGKRQCVSLREQIAELQKQQILNPGGASTNMSMIELVERYLKQKTGVRESTKAGYKTVTNMLNKEPFGKKRIKDIWVSDAKLWLIGLQDGGRGYSSIHSIRGVVRPAFQMAVDDDLLVKNPFGFELATVLINDSVKREAITAKQERQFLEFVQSDKHFCRYYDAIYILFKTGMRISEFFGLTKSDLDMENRIITVERQLQRTSGMEYIIEETKTDAGMRRLAMSPEVYDCFKRILENRKGAKVEPIIGGRTGFLYLDKNGMPMVALHWEKYFQHIREKYNKIYKVQMPMVLC